MSEVMISPAPTPLPGGTGSANALGPSEASKRSGDSAKSDTESGTKAPFAAELKSRMDAAAENGVKSPESAAAEMPAEMEIDVDISALFQFLGTNPGGTATPVAGTEPAAASPDETALPALLSQAAELTAEVPAVPHSPPAVTPGTSPRRQHPEAEKPTPAGPAIADSSGRASGKIALDAAINADVSSKSGGKNVPEPLANEFHALLERATAMTPGAAKPPNGPSSSPSLRIDTPLGQTGWHDEIGQKLTWMAGNNRQQADLVLTPPHLGRVEVSLTMNGDQATAIFTSANPAVREALEGSLHRLREVLADAGVSLGQTQVGSESPNQSARGNPLDLGMTEAVRYAATIPVPGVAPVARGDTRRGMIDIFA